MLKGIGTSSHVLTHSAIFVLLAAALSAFSQSTPTSSPTKPAGGDPSVSEITASYTNFQRMTKDPVYVNPELAALCRGISKEEVDAARVRLGPHANTAIVIFMNKQAAEAFNTNASVFPVGSVIVKQKTIFGYPGRLTHGKDEGVGGMVKRTAGYDPGHGDWEYFYTENSLPVRSGPMQSCVQCHTAAKDKDYVFGTWRKIGG